MTAPDRTLTMPYPGLRPFEAEDEPLFFGREAQVSAMLRQLEDHSFVAVVGSSGCGKSSLVRAGLLPVIREGFLLGTTDWLTAIMKPGQQPYHNLAGTLIETSRASGATPGHAGGSEQAGREETRTLSTLRRTDRGLLEALRELGISPESNVLLVVDQFEELFAFRRAGVNRDAVASRDEAAAFVSLLLRSCADATGRLWVVLTMRSDFIGDCEAFLGLPEMVSRSQFLVPRLDRGQMEEAIAGPGMVEDAAYRPFTFADGLVNRIINDAGDLPDQLPLMQHALMRTWKLAEQRSRDSDSIELTLDDYNVAGGIENALSLDADAAWNSLNNDARQGRITRQLFLLLCDISPEGQITRRRPSVDEIQAATGASVEELGDVIRAFQDDDRNFLLPPRQQGVGPQTPVDVSHEALLRHWHLFATEWLEQERRDASELRRLADLATLYNSKEGGPLQAQDLERVTRWRERVSPEWARRYVPKDRWDEAVAFIDTSEREHEARRAAKAKARKRALARARWAALAFGTIAVALVAGIVRHRYLYVSEHAAYYNDFVKIYGAPKGIGLLTAQQVQRRPWSTRIVQKGRRGPVQRMEAVNGRGEPTGRHSIGTYLSESPDEQEQKEVRWDFLYGADGRVAYEVAFDKRGKQLWTWIYSPASETGGRVRLAQFVGPDGYPRPAPGYGHGFVRIEYSPAGYEELITYRNSIGEPRAGLDKAFGRRQTFDAEGRLTELVSVDPKGQPMIDEAGNAGLTVTYDRLGNGTEHVATDASGAITTLKSGFARARTAYDSNGNPTEQAFFDENNRPTQIKEGYHRWSQRLDDRGRVEEVRYWDVEAKPTLSADGCHGQRYAYDERDNLTTMTCLGMPGQPAPNQEGITATILKYDDHGQTVEVEYADAAGRAVASSKGYSRTTFSYDERGNTIGMAYFGADGRPVPTEQGYSSVKSEFDSRDNETSRSHFGTDRRPLLIVDPERDSVPMYASWKKRYDGNGNQVSETFFDVAGRVMVGADGYASWHNTYDESGNRIEVAYFGPQRERVRSKNGYAVWRSEYDDLGRQIGVEYFDVRGTPVTSDEGIAGWKSRFDGQNNEIERRYYGVDGQPARHKDGEAGWGAQYDRRGNRIDIRYVDTKGRPALSLWDSKSPGGGGYARNKVEFDVRNRVVNQEYFGVRGEYVSRPEGWSRAVHRYDLIGDQPIESAFFGTDDKPAVVVKEGYHKIRRRLDGYGRVIEVTYFDPDGAAMATAGGYAKLRNTYDSYGRLTEQAIFASDGSPAASASGEHKWVKQYDQRGRLVEQRWFGTRNEPVQISGNGQHYTRYAYDDRGNTIEVAHFDIQGNPALGPDPTNTSLCSRWTGQYDAVSRVQSKHCETSTAPTRPKKTSGRVDQN